MSKQQGDPNLNVSGCFGMLCDMRIRVLVLFTWNSNVRMLSAYRATDELIGQVL
jgi:hypothetical protein